MRTRYLKPSKVLLSWAIVTAGLLVMQPGISDARLSRGSAGPVQSRVGVNTISTPASTATHRSGSMFIGSNCGGVCTSYPSVNTGSILRRSETFVASVLVTSSLPRVRASLCC